MHASMMAVPKQGGIVDRATVKRSIGFHKSHFKCVFVGDGVVGKSTLLRSFTRGKYIKIEFVPTSTPEHLEATVMVDGKHVQLELWDTQGAEDYDRLRPLCYPQTDVFLICYDVGSHPSFENTRYKWYPHVRHHCSKIPIVLLANKIDLRTDAEAIAQLSRRGLAPLTYTQGLKMQKKIGAVAYAECSALTYEGVTTLFEEVIPAAAMSAVKKQRGWKIKGFSKKI